MIKLTDKQIEYLTVVPHRWNFKTGATRSGKSFVDVSAVIPKRIIERQGKQGLNLILGVSRETIERNVLLPMREIYSEKRVGYINNSKNVAVLFGEDVYCLGAEKISQVAKIQGTSVKYCYGDEVAKWNKEVFEMLKSRLDKPYSCFDGSCNPEYPTHWLKTFLDSDVDKYVQKYTIFDNPYLPKEYVDNLCKEYKGTVWYDRFILGEWKRAEGSIYTSYLKNKSKVLVNSLKCDDTDKDKRDDDIDFIQIGVDFGGNKSKHTIVATGLKKDGSVLYVLKSRRYNAKETSPDDINNIVLMFVKSIMKKYDIPIRAVYCDSAEQVLINGIRTYLRDENIYIPIMDSIKKPIMDRVRFVELLISTGRFFMIKSECETLDIALTEAVFDDKKDNDVRLDNFTTDIDTLDAFEYSFESMMKVYERG